MLGFARNYLTKVKESSRIRSFKRRGYIPWSNGYHEYKWKEIAKAIKNNETMRELNSGYGFRIDERIIEYPWVISKLNESSKIILDAGSTFNFDLILEHPKLKGKEITICTLYPESPNFVERRINYVFADLRNLLFRDNCFDTVVSISTIEHIGMDNSIYGEQSSENRLGAKSYSYLEAILEYLRVLKHDGQMLLTAPFGAYENHGFFQQFDSEMLSKLKSLLQKHGKVETIDFYKYEERGWIRSGLEDCQFMQSYNPHTGQGKKMDNAAHCRSVFCLQFRKN
jgi:SAM-dependent methyltransferase